MSPRPTCLAAEPCCQSVNDQGASVFVGSRSHARSARAISATAPSPSAQAISAIRLPPRAQHPCPEDGDGGNSPRPHVCQRHLSVGMFVENDRQQRSRTCHHDRPAPTHHVFGRQRIPDSNTCSALFEFSRAFSYITVGAVAVRKASATWLATRVGDRQQRAGQGLALAYTSSHTFGDHRVIAQRSDQCSTPGRAAVPGK